MRRIAKAGLVFLAASLAAGCAYGIQTAMFRPPYAPTTAVDVYRDKPPDRPYVEIAQLATYDGGNALGRLVERAKELGADAVIILPRVYAGTNFAYDWASAYYEVGVVAIKYR